MLGPSTSGDVGPNDDDDDDGDDDDDDDATGSDVGAVGDRIDRAAGLCEGTMESERGSPQDSPK